MMNFRKDCGVHLDTIKSFVGDAIIISDPSLQNESELMICTFTVENAFQILDKLANLEKNV